MSRAQSILMASDSKDLTGNNLPEGRLSSITHAHNLAHCEFPSFRCQILQARGLGVRLYAWIKKHVYSLHFLQLEVQYGYHHSIVTIGLHHLTHPILNRGSSGQNNWHKLLDSEMGTLHVSWQVQLELLLTPKGSTHLLDVSDTRLTSYSCISHHWHFVLRVHKSEPPLYAGSWLRWCGRFASFDKSTSHLRISCPDMIILAVYEGAANNWKRSFLLRLFLPLQSFSSWCNLGSFSGGSHNSIDTVFSSILRSCNFGVGMTSHPWLELSLSWRSWAWFYCCPHTHCSQLFPL